MPGAHSPGGVGELRGRCRAGGGRSVLLVSGASSAARSAGASVCCVCWPGTPPAGAAAPGWVIALLGVPAWLGCLILPVPDGALPPVVLACALAACSGHIAAGRVAEPGFVPPVSGRFRPACCVVPAACRPPPGLAGSPGYAAGGTISPGSSGVGAALSCPGAAPPSPGGAGRSGAGPAAAAPAAAGPIGGLGALLGSLSPLPGRPGTLARSCHCAGIVAGRGCDAASVAFVGVVAS